MNPAAKKEWTLDEVKKLVAAPSQGARTKSRKCEDCSDFWKTVAQRLAKSQHGSVLIPFAVRAVVDSREKRPLTAAQSALAGAIAALGLEDRLMSRFEGLPPAVRNAINNSIIDALDGPSAEKQMRSRLEQGAKITSQEVANGAGEYEVFGGFHSFFLEKSEALQMVKFPIPPAVRKVPRCPTLYHARLEYRGISISRAHDRSGGVEPYLLTPVYRIPNGSALSHEFTSPMKVEQHPKNLGENAPGYWWPSGGAKANGDPKNPVQFHPKVTTYQTVDVGLFDVVIPVPGRCSIDETPLLLANDLHLVLVSGWEEDGDDSAKAMRAVGQMMQTVGPLLVGSPGTVIVVIGGLLELASWLTASGDDAMGDFVIVLDGAAMAQDGYRELSRRVGRGRNDWKIYLGLETKRLPESGRQVV